MSKFYKGDFVKIYVPEISHKAAKEITLSIIGNKIFTEIVV